MASFAEVERVEPDLADRVRAVLSSTTNAVLGSGADPYLHDGQLCIWSMPQARIGPGPSSGPAGCAAQHLVGLTAAAPPHGVRAWLQAERGVEPPADWDLFTIDIDALTIISADTGQLVVDRWSTNGGRRTTRRGER